MEYHEGKSHDVGGKGKLYPCSLSTYALAQNVSWADVSDMRTPVSGVTDLGLAL